MKNGHYIFALALLTLLLFGVSQWLENDVQKPHEQSQLKQKSGEGKTKQATRRASASRPNPATAPITHVVRLYPSGSISVVKPVPEKKSKKPEKKIAKPLPPATLSKVRPTEKPVTKAVAQDLHQEKRAAIPASNNFTGDRPVLEVGYDQIGFDRYIQVMERVGRLYVLVEGAQGVALGPEVSLARQELLGDRGLDKARYAVERPHLISDRFIVDRLTRLQLPPAALKDRVVLVFNTPFDDLLWSVIDRTLADQNMRLEDIARVSADYVPEGGGIFLKFSHAIAKKNLKHLLLEKTMRVTL